ncbi:related to tRNA 2'-phosphotransferase [Saccharomycodes ludwigii]|uniref:2'-phosphotransferase n=1 Tax=Saccharomycodes ludwigii TaxID=36035 RepID=A0A376B564_9ASCO|nr:hypothetical protein SCDLUD_002404 [Saccharomycodes ludwigii]KAH3900943.1 hypothetical protein SCDLUD_002404 [Saccharomycodes ludwigii]SSD59828.1 related to tRNA 2'-phosphotransferase [Saccharomycodes ludwigii]
MTDSNKKRDILISKALSYLLRHGAIKEQLNIGTDGYVLLNELLQHNRLKSHKATKQDIIRIVATNDKQRFQLERLENDDGILLEEYKIRATQGHSIKSIENDKILVKINDYPYDSLIHGTSLKNIILILKSCYGLSRMNRNHIHLSPGIIGKDKYVISGMRYNTEIFIYLNFHRMMKDGGITIYRSVNNVFLVEDNIPIDYFEKIVYMVNKESNTGPQGGVVEKKQQELIQLCKEHGIKLLVVDNSFVPVIPDSGH